ncbi:MAG: alpha/beta hydrolase [Deltaproteobacteria bacterium]|nr:alpha/beta hydrolase [Deltaproteobacteria bacterium]
MALDAFKMMGEQMAKAGNDLKALRGVMEGASVFPSAGETKCTPVSAGGVPAEWIAGPGAADDRVILYVHGGGYVMGSINTHREVVARLSKASGARGLALEYRLAPEHPFPAPVEDATAAYRWLLSQNIKPSNIVVAGDSAGGGLTVATLLAIRDAKLPLPAAGVCISPWVDMEGTGESMKTRAKADPVVQKEGLLGMAQLYLGGKDPKSPLAAPLHADLKGLPPLLIQVGDAETLLDDSTRLADKAKKAGVKVELEVWPEMPHVWHLFAPFLPEGQQAIEKIGKYVRQITA